MFAKSPYRTETQLLVPVGSLEAYKTANVWKDFFKIVPADLIELTDGQPYTNEYDKEVSLVRYTRNFTETQKGNWQSIYVPFAIDVEKYKDEFDIAKIFTICPYKDTDGNGVIDGNDDLYMFFTRLTEGETLPNVPYVIRPKKSGECVIEASGRLAKAEKGTISFSTSETSYTVVGIYENKVLTPGDNNYYMASTGELFYRESTNGTLRPNKWYMHADYHGYGTESASSAPRRILTSTIGEDIDEETAIRLIESDVIATMKNDLIYNLNGIRMNESSTLPSGIYIKNGKRIMIK